MKLFRLLAFGLLCPFALRGAEEDRNALRLLDTYLAREALATPEYRADPQPGGDPARLPPNRLFASGPLLGPFTYRPKTYAELSLPQRAELLRTSRFRAFIARIPVAPEDMLSPRPLLVTLPDP